LDPISKEVIEYSLPHDLYILGAMNQADASIEPLDIAFLRRWEPLNLNANEGILRDFYQLGDHDGRTLPSTLTIPDALEASVRALKAVNEQISLGRGSEFQVGHGVLMSDVGPSTLGKEEALEVLCMGWAKVIAHVEEVFFGDIRSIAETLNCLHKSDPGNPYSFVEATFAGEHRFKLVRPENLTPSTIYHALRAFSRE
jgi:5-methylcytosine-specific restriction protein B